MQNYKKRKLLLFILLTLFQLANSQQNNSRVTRASSPVYIKNNNARRYSTLLNEDSNVPQETRQQKYTTLIDNIAVDSIQDPIAAVDSNTLQNIVHDIDNHYDHLVGNYYGEHNHSNGVEWKWPGEQDNNNVVTGVSDADGGGWGWADPGVTTGGIDGLHPFGYHQVTPFETGVSVEGSGLKLALVLISLWYLVIAIFASGNQFSAPSSGAGSCDIMHLPEDHDVDWKVVNADGVRERAVPHPLQSEINEMFLSSSSGGGGDSSEEQSSLMPPEMSTIVSQASSICSQSSFFYGQNRGYMGAAMMVKDMFMQMPTPMSMLQMAMSVRPQLNSKMWYTALMHAQRSRDDMGDIQLPCAMDAMPDLFVPGIGGDDSKERSHHDDECVKVDGSVGKDNGVENKLWYFREDVMVNSHHWYWHLQWPLMTRMGVGPMVMVPVPPQKHGMGGPMGPGGGPGGPMGPNGPGGPMGPDGPGPDKQQLPGPPQMMPAPRKTIPLPMDRRGELFYFMHRMLVYRYNIERHCNGLPPTEPMDFKGPVLPPYNPHLTDHNAGMDWTPREGVKFLRDLEHQDNPADRTVILLRDWFTRKGRLYKAIDGGYFVTPTFPFKRLLTEKTGIDMLANTVEAVDISVNPAYYGRDGFHNDGHRIIAGIEDPDFKKMLPPGPMGDPGTAMRDPIFYRFHTNVNDFFERYKKTLKPYDPVWGTHALHWPGVHLKSVRVLSKSGSVNHLKTFYSKREFPLHMGLAFNRTNDHDDHEEIDVCHKHLDHEEFVYEFDVFRAPCAISKSNTATFRIFIAPKFDKDGRRFTIHEQRKMFVHLDVFNTKLPPGWTKVRRSSLASSLTIPYQQTLMQQNRGNNAAEPNCGCGWPHHLLLPKGSSKGKPFDLFVMVTNGDDFIPPKSPHCSKAWLFCGVNKERYPDTRPMGYPFDRPIFKGTNCGKDVGTFAYKVCRAFGLGGGRKVAFIEDFVEFGVGGNGNVGELVVTHQKKKMKKKDDD